MKLLMNRTAARMCSGSNSDHSNPYRHIRSLVTASALLSTLSALPASAQTINEDIKIIASDAAAGDQFGISVAISGTTAIIGANTDDDGGSGSGSVYLFDTETGDQIAKLTASDAASGDIFGISVAISGTTAIIGAYGNDDAGSLSGSAYLFDTTTGLQLFKLTASDAAADDIFGRSVAIWGTTAIVGAWGDDDTGLVSGSAYLFDTTTGLQITKLTASDAASGDLFGWSVAISGTTAIVGAYGNDDAGTESGSVYLFDTTSGLQTAKFTASDAAAGDFFGISVAISGTTAIVGARYDDNSGSAYLFDTETGDQIAKLTASDAAANDQFGSSVAISGTTAIVGAWRDDDAGFLESGSAYQFDTTTGLQIAKLTASDAATSDWFGSSVAVSGATVIVGAYQDDDTGSAYLFDFGPNILQQPLGTIVTAGETAEFNAMLADETGVSFQWRRNGIDLLDGGNISGALSSTLQIVTTVDDTAYYDCVVTNGLGSTTTDPAVLAVTPDPNACIVDLNDDGSLNFFDVSLFLQLFGMGCP